MSALSEEATVRLDHVSVAFGQRLALAEVSLHATRGEFLALTGPNGSGKTTLLKTVLGFLAPRGGRVELLGQGVGELTVRERARRVAWVPQDESVRDDVALLDYVLYGRYAHHRRFEPDRPEEATLARDVLERVGLAGFADRGLRSVSGGERQRATLARAFVQATPVLLLDEPTAHLDIGHQLDILERVRRLAKEDGRTVVAALHDLNLAARFADRIVVLSRGRVVADGTPRAVLSEELLDRVWGISAELHREPRSGVPYLVPRHRSVPSREATLPALGPVHVVGGGGAARPILHRLVDEGFVVTAGALHLLDSDTETAEALGLACAVEGPFTPLGEACRARHHELLAAARAVVVAPFAVGPSNLANLEDLADAVPSTPTFLLNRPPIAARDFCGGRAAAAHADLVRRGAREFLDLEALLAAVRAALGAPAPIGAGTATTTGAER